jgi:hypothetical protein
MKNSVNKNKISAALRNFKSQQMKISCWHYMRKVSKRRKVTVGWMRLDRPKNKLK